MALNEDFERKLKAVKVPNSVLSALETGGLRNEHSLKGCFMDANIHNEPTGVPDNMRGLVAKVSGNSAKLEVIKLLWQIANPKSKRPPRKPSSPPVAEKPTLAQIETNPSLLGGLLSGGGIQQLVALMGALRVMQGGGDPGDLRMLASMFPPSEMVKMYDPGDPNNFGGIVIKGTVGASARPIIFQINAGQITNTVFAAASEARIKQLIEVMRTTEQLNRPDQYQKTAESATFTFEGNTYPTYPVFVLPMQSWPEDPFFKGELIWSDGSGGYTCNVTEPPLYYSPQADQRVREFMRYLWETSRVFDPRSEYKRDTIIELANTGGFEALAQKYQAQAILFAQAEINRTAPRLIIMVDSSKIPGGDFGQTWQQTMAAQVAHPYNPNTPPTGRNPYRHNDY